MRLRESHGALNLPPAQRLEALRPGRIVGGTSLAFRRDVSLRARFLPLLILAAVAACAHPRPQAGPFPADLPPVPQGMSVDAWVHAHAAYARAEHDGYAPRPILTVIDYS